MADSVRDTVEVVRCKNCKHHETVGATLIVTVCRHYDRVVDPCDYCSYGEVDDGHDNEV